MYFYYMAVVAAAAVLATPALACKCFVNGNQDDGKTQSCCNELNGVFRYGNDCAASSISEHLSNFRSCCGGQSDCDYPKEADEEEEKAGDGQQQQQNGIKTIVVI